MSVPVPDSSSSYIRNELNKGLSVLKNRRKKMAQSDCGIYCSGQFSGVLKSKYYIYYYSFWTPYKYRQVHTGL